MADFNFVGLMGVLSLPAQIKSDGTAFFGMKMRTHQGDIQFTVITNLNYLVERSIGPYMIEKNIGKRIFVIGSIAGDNVIFPTKIHFIDNLISLEEAKKMQGEEIDFSND